MSTRLLLTLAVLAAAGEARAQCGADHSSCPQAAGNGTELCAADLLPVLTQAARNELGAAGPTYRQIDHGCNHPLPVMPVNATVPCGLVDAIAVVESDWQEFCSTCGGAGSKLISFDCGYGILQVTSGMGGGAGFDPAQVAGSSAYDVATGITILLDKWAATPCVGDNRPEVAEDWYMAVWAYNGFGWVNNPNNPNFPALRPAYRSPNTLSRGNYHYQEIVWGYANYQVLDSGAPRYPALALTLPDSTQICNTQGCSVTDVPDPSPIHCDECQRGNAVTLASQVPSGALALAPGQTGSFTLTLQNAGQSTWTAANDVLVKVSGESLGPDSIPLSSSVAPGSTVPITVSVTAPTATGSHTETYQLSQDPCGFGPTFALTIDVTPAGSSSTSTASPSSSVASSSQSSSSTATASSRSSATRRPHHATSDSSASTTTTGASARGATTGGPGAKVKKGCGCESSDQGVLAFLGLAAALRRARSVLR